MATQYAIGGACEYLGRDSTTIPILLFAMRNQEMSTRSSQDIEMTGHPKLRMGQFISESPDSSDNASQHAQSQSSIVS